MASSFQFGAFRLDLASKQLWQGEEPIVLTPKALDLLIYFVEHAGEVLMRERLFEALWPGVNVASQALTVQILEIRKALGDDVHTPRYIETRHRRGYRFMATVTRLPELVAATEPLPSAAVSHVSPMPAAVGAFAMPETCYVNSGGVNIAYQVVGDGPVDLVFVMGWVSHLEYFWTEPRFARFLQRLSSFARVILFDKRGTGLSDRVPLDQLPTIEQRMEDVHAVMDKIGSERAVICGISEGGCMSAVFAATYPERALALVMIATYARRLWAPDYPWAPTVEQREVLFREIREHWGGPVGLEQRAPSLAADRHFREWWAAYLRMGASPGAALALTTMNTETDIRHVLPLVQVPTLVLHRSGDLCLKVEEGRFIASQIPNSRLIELPGNDHLPFVGDQEAILQRLEEFLAQVQSGAEPASVLATALVAEFAQSVAPGSPLDLLIRASLQRFRVSHTQHSGAQVIAAFDGPARAVQCALALQQQVRKTGIQSRIGLHTGEFVGIPQAPLGGPAVSVAQVVLARAVWGQMLASGTLRDLVAGSGITFRSHGRIEAAGVGEWQLLEVEQPAGERPAAAAAKPV